MAADIKMSHHAQPSNTSVDLLASTQIVDVPASSRQPSGVSSLAASDGQILYRPDPFHRIGFMAGRDDFRDARLRSALACEEYNKLAEDAAPEERVSKWLNMVDPNNKIERAPPVHFSAQWKKERAPSSMEARAPVPVPTRPTIPYVKTPFHMDYGLRVHIAPTTFINRNCFIMDTPVGDIVIGEHCSIGPNVTIIGVGHPVQAENRLEFATERPGSWGARVTVGDGVWIGAGCTILPGITIGDGSTIGAGSVVTRDIPPRCVAAGNPAKVFYSLDEGRPEGREYVSIAMTLEEALRTSREDDRLDAAVDVCEVPRNWVDLKKLSLRGN